MKRLDNVTLVIADCVDVDRALRALRYSMKHFEFAEVLFFTDLEHPQIDGVKFVEVEHFRNIYDYSHFCIKELHKYINTSHCLIVQHDGYILNPDAWSDEFMNYDYIGAVWTENAQIFLNNLGINNPKNRVGNGGFSLRSKRLLAVCAEIIPFDKYFIEAKYLGLMKRMEDLKICLEYFDILTNIYEMKFAPVGIASKFSIENGVWNGEFGFHNFNCTDLTNYTEKNYV